MMRSNRRIRDQIQNRHGADTVDEVSKWNDSWADSFAEYGEPLPRDEELVQQDMLELLAIEEELMGSGTP